MNRPEHNDATGMMVQDFVDMVIAHTVQVLGRHEVLATDNLFSLGVDSLGIAEIADRLGEETGIAVPLEWFLEAADIHELAVRLATANRM